MLLIFKCLNCDLFDDYCLNYDLADLYDYYRGMIFLIYLNHLSKL